MKAIRNYIKRMKKSESFKRLSSFFRESLNSKEFIVISLLLVILGIIILVTLLSFVFGEEVREEIVELTVVEEVVDEAIRHPLTGEILEEALETQPEVFSCMVENSADAWPLVGVNDAFLVIEAPVEGNIPRFITFFDKNAEVEKLGPVRSARPYYIDWADEFNAIYGHVGGSPEALGILDTREDVVDLDQFYESEYYWRQTTGGRYAPHNVYISSERFVDAFEEYSVEPSYETWLFKEDMGSQGESGLMVDMGNGSTYDVTWIYDAEKNTYIRQQGSQIMEMEDGDIVEVNNVVVFSTDIQVIDDVGRKSLETIGEGEALLAQDGKNRFVTWRKNSPDDRLRFYDQEGNEVRFNPGKTWIQVVSSLVQVEWK